MVLTYSTLVVVCAGTILVAGVWEALKLGAGLVTAVVLTVQQNMSGGGAKRDDDDY